MCVVSLSIRPFDLLITIPSACVFGQRYTPSFLNRKQHSLFTSMCGVAVNQAVRPEHHRNYSRAVFGPPSCFKVDSAVLHTIVIL